jgi:hypothetical protein
MSRLELVLVGWPDGADLEGPRLMGRLSDEDLVSEAQDRLAAGHVRRLRELRPPVRPVPDPPEGTEE